jgi:hypothetical protein
VFFRSLPSGCYSDRSRGQAVTRIAELRSSSFWLGMQNWQEAGERRTNIRPAMPPSNATTYGICSSGGDWLRRIGGRKPIRALVRLSSLAGAGRPGTQSCTHHVLSQGGRKPSADTVFIARRSVTPSVILLCRSAGAGSLGRDSDRLIDKVAHFTAIMAALGQSLFIKRVLDHQGRHQPFLGIGPEIGSVRT